MSKRAHANKPPTAPADKVVHLRIPDDLDTKAAEVAAKVKLKKPDAMRLAMDRGLDILRDQLSSAAPAA
jgi:hypothetical protein